MNKFSYSFKLFIILLKESPLSIKNLKTSSPVKSGVKKEIADNPNEKVAAPAVLALIVPPTAVPNPGNNFKNEPTILPVPAKRAPTTVVFERFLMISVASDFFKFLPNKDAILIIIDAWIANKRGQSDIGNGIKPTAAAAAENPAISFLLIDIKLSNISSLHVKPSKKGDFLTNSSVF